MTNPLITVIIPAYNCSRLINNAIESVLAQTYTNYELIVVDDGSVDDTSEKVAVYRDRLQYVYQTNGGVSKARNTGIRQSRGEYISFLDADDVWEKNKLEIQMHLFEKYSNVYMIFSSFKHIKKNNIIENKKYEDTFNIFKEYKYEIGDIFKNHSTFQYKNNNIEYYWGNIYKYLFLGNFILPSSVVFKKSSLKRVGMLNEAYKVAEETEFFLRFSKYYDVGFINDPLLYYEAPEPDNLSGKKNTERLIKNALKIQIDSIISNQNELETDDMFFKGISITHSRLAYYYLSEYRMLDSRKYALCGIKTYRRNIMPYMIFIISYIPQSVLNYLLKMKHIIADN